MTERALHQPFPGLERQREADRFGMLIFLSSEVMLFGALFASAFVLRIAHSAAYAAASGQMHYWLGGINTAVLLTSSLCVALAVLAVRSERPGTAKAMLCGAILLGLAFIAIKSTEYVLEYRDGLVPILSPSALDGGPRQLFMNLYFITTGLHALHVTIGLVILASLIWPFGRVLDRPDAVTIGNAALYWHLVDIVWVFLYPTLYLAR